MSGLLRQYAFFLRHHVAWWLVPFLLLLALLLAAAWLSDPGSPFRYPAE